PAADDAPPPAIDLFELVSAHASPALPPYDRALGQVQLSHSPAPSSVSGGDGVPAPDVSHSDTRRCWSFLPESHRKRSQDGRPSGMTSSPSMTTAGHPRA